MVLPLLLLAGLAQATDCPALDAELAAIDASSRCLTDPLRQASLRAAALGEQACLTAALADRGLPATLWAETPRQVPALFQPDKLVQDSYGLPNSIETENFVAWWGDGASVDRHAVDDMLDAFEAGWDYEVELMELPQPETTETYKFNVYIGDTGSGAPSVYGNAGYFYYDHEGFPMIVMSQGCLNDHDYGKTTAVHELFHAVQAATDHYGGSSYRWIWEATATWVEGEVYPDNPYYASFLFGFAFLPHLPLDFYDYPDEGILEEYHQYGAFIFPRYLSEIAADWTLVRDVWTRGSYSADPLEVFDTLLAERGTTLMEAWTGFNAHNVVWDYADGNVYDWYLDAYDDYYDSYWLAASSANAGSDEWMTPTQRLPQRFGVNNIELRYPNDGTLHVEIDLDDAGSSGSPATWAVTLVREGYGLEYIPLEPVDGSIQHTVEDIGADRNVYLVIGATCPTERYAETFGYSYRMWVEEPIDTSPPEDTGDGGGDAPKACGCAAGGVVSVGWLALGLVGVIVGVRRRRG